MFRGAVFFRTRCNCMYSSGCHTGHPWVINILWPLLLANEDGGLIWRTGSIFSCSNSKGLWDCLYETNHNTASVRVLVSQPIAAYVSHICSWWISLAAASGDPVILLMTLCQLSIRAPVWRLSWLISEREMDGPTATMETGFLQLQIRSCATAFQLICDKLTLPFSD